MFPEYHYNGLPVNGDIVSRYVVMQPSPSGRAWQVMCQRFRLDYCYDAMAGLDLTRKTVIVRVGPARKLHMVRSWN